jgi:5-methyltetrahydropteroyltriglutamate--homocysteine methyltransferase
MAAKGNPPFRADHVGSLLRPKKLLEARERRAKGEIAAADLRKVEDEAIRGAVKLQEDAGLEAITDGEYRRTFFHIDFLERIKGVAVKGGIPLKFHGAKRDVDFAPPKLVVESTLQRSQPITVADFDFLKAQTKRTAKLCIPSPTMVHFRGGRGAIDEHSYPDIEQFFADLAKIYREEIADLAAHGCTYLQLDDTNLAYLCDPKLREGARKIGEDPDKLPHIYAKLINDCIKSRGPDMTVGIHLCRGNFQSAWVAEGGYEPVAEALFNEIDVDAYFLEYDDPRSGDFAPLRFVPKNKIVVLGLVSSKLPELETKDSLKRRIDQAARHVAMDHLCLSPQCGFSSTVHGNDITEKDEIAKLRLVVETARDVWGSA